MKTSCSVLFIVIAFFQVCFRGYREFLFSVANMDDEEFIVP